MLGDEHHVLHPGFFRRFGPTLHDLRRDVHLAGCCVPIRAGNAVPGPQPFAVIGLAHGLAVEAALQSRVGVPVDKQPEAGSLEPGGSGSGCRSHREKGEKRGENHGQA